jgi:poly(A) polymerase/tRNA nucleotidyltransferase (CCA-adding enzyme)
VSDAPHFHLSPVPPILLAGTPAAVLAALPGARAVGGAVRDALAGLPLADVDIAAPFPPEEIARRCAAAGLGVFETGLAHGTLTVVREHQPVEVTALRRDVATDGRHARVEWIADWREDAARRDFTINAMSCDATGAAWDWFGGREDLAAGRVRFVGDPATRLAEDHLRALRFFRFHARYGRGAPDPAALAAIAGSVPLLARLSAERVWSELKRLLLAADPTASIALMHAAGVLGAVFPEARHFEALGRLVAIGAPADPLLRTAALIGPDRDAAALRALAARLRLSGEERAALLHLGAPPRPFWPADAPLRRELARREPIAEADIWREAWLAEAWDGVDRAALRAAMAQAKPWPAFPLQGRDALAGGLPPGPEVGRVLAALRAEWLAEGAAGDHAAWLERLRERLR